METTTIEVTTGMKIIVRKAVTPLTFWLTRIASARARPDWQGTTISAKKAVFVRDRMKVGSSVKARTKFSIPMNCGGLGEMRRVLVKDRMKVSRIGMPMKSRRSTSAGELMSHAVRASRRSAALLPRRLVMVGAAMSVPFPAGRSRAPPDRC